MGVQQMDYKRGDIVLVDFNPAKGGEMGKLRPAVVMSSAEEVQMLQTVIVIPLSTVIEPDSFPYRYTLQPRERLKKQSDACIYEIRALSKKRIKEKIADLNKDELQSIQRGLCAILG